MGSTPIREQLATKPSTGSTCASFTGTAGDLRFSNSTLAGDVNGDRKADFEIVLSGVTKMFSDDLIA